MHGEVDQTIKNAIYAIIAQTVGLWESTRYLHDVISKRLGPTDRTARLRFNRLKALINTMFIVGCGVAIADGRNNPADLRIGLMSLVTPEMRIEIGDLAVELIDLIHPEAQRRDCELCRKARRSVRRRLTKPDSEVS
ncbi:MAG: hypothetical protein ACLQU2_03355 [Candidatus Binataceae bacterium]